MRDCRGSLTIEFAILFPVLFLLLVGGLDLGMVMLEKMQLEFATEAAARCGGTKDPNCLSSTDAEVYAATLITTPGISSSNFSVSPLPCVSGSGSVVTATASYTYTPMILPVSVPIGASAHYSCTP
jgi:TadE-like protein